MQVFDNRREKESLHAIANAMSNIKAEKTGDVINELKGSIFVELEYDAQKFLIKSRDKFKKTAQYLANKKIRPIGGADKYRDKSNMPFKLGKPFNA